MEGIREIYLDEPVSAAVDLEILGEPHGETTIKSRSEAFLAKLGYTQKLGIFTTLLMKD